MRMDPDIKRRLEEQAARPDRSAAWVAQRAIEDFLSDAKTLFGMRCAKPLKMMMARAFRVGRS